MRRLLVPLALVLSLGGCGWLGRSGETSKPDNFQLHGYASVAGAAAGLPGTPCLAPASAPDIVAGAPVKAADAGGKVIAVTTLASGVLATASDGYRCNFAFELLNLSGSRPAYQIVVAERPPVSFETRAVREGRPAVVDVPASAVTGSPSPS
ncbi:hypothetical protein Daura_05245 [Dactylosporangium aurantiacum]|uniref:Lipoprotein n=1 Tax=Dactylosporangium aurantiacum TaxID=35754 RepID=A0A9Q9IGI3_9ACTN|nr:hypothetical protein [Dactylosporangium aurantiacum]MDG6104828.1 hypothetical protein [Dactylosporangium aurantiacum]UWZ55622.1 hypothetical protein Daura_05245 [Dactylosporangium aurantiacum]